MKIFISGTNTNIGKTLVCSWLCLHSNYSYFKPIQTGTSYGYDSLMVTKLSGAKIHPETFTYKAALSPHLASLLENEEINMNKIMLPSDKNLIVEGAGGLLVPLNKEFFMIDLITYLKIPVIIVANSLIGTINHTLLSIEALKSRQLPILGIIINGPLNNSNCSAIEFYGKIKVLASLDFMHKVNKDRLHDIPLTPDLQQILLN